MSGSRQPEVTVYWRPACPFCTRLLLRLEESGIDHRRMDIWEDTGARPSSARASGGNETAPTVVVADRAMVHPSFRELCAALLPG